MGRRKKKRRPEGFSEPWSKPAYDAFSDMLDVHGPDKRGVLNVFSIAIAGATALSTGFTGCFIAVESGLGVVAGWILGLFAGATVFSVVMGWLRDDRYYRP